MIKTVEKRRKEPAEGEEAEEEQWEEIETESVEQKDPGFDGLVHYIG